MSSYLAFEGLVTSKIDVSLKLVYSMITSSVLPIKQGSLEERLDVQLNDPRFIDQLFQL